MNTHKTKNNNDNIDNYIKNDNNNDGVLCHLGLKIKTKFAI